MLRVAAEVFEAATTEEVLLELAHPCCSIPFEISCAFIKINNY